MLNTIPLSRRTIRRGLASIPWNGLLSAVYTIASDVSKKSEMATPEPVSRVRLLLRSKFFMTRCHIDRRLSCSAGEPPHYYTLFRARNFAGGRRAVRDIEIGVWVWFQDAGCIAG